MSEHQKPLLEINNLQTYFYTKEGVVKAVDGVGFHVNPGEVLCLVGESGCGKSVTSLSIMGLINKPGDIIGGEVIFEGKNLLDLPEKEMVKVRGNEISIIFQQPQSSLNPVYKVGNQISEVFRLHGNMNRKEMRKQSVELFKLVGIPDADEKVFSYPHEMSGGQAQRVMIAMALALDPKLLIADEPTTALDVTIQAQILDLMRDLKDKKGTAMILITHDLGVVAEMADRVAVMYAGVILEQAGVNNLFESPLHPYTKGLLGSTPTLGSVKEYLDVVPGIVPSLVDLPPGCRFAPRCQSRIDYDLDICTEKEPSLDFINPEHSVRCWLYQSKSDYSAPINPLEIKEPK